MQRPLAALLLVSVMTFAVGCAASGHTAPRTTGGTTRTTREAPMSTSTSTSASGVTSTSRAGGIVVAPLSSATADGAFLSPDRNLACQVAQNPSSQVRCVSFAPPLLVVMTADGTLTRCTGGSCALGSPASGTPILAYGSGVGNPEFVCVSTTAGITCTVPAGRGFTISKAGVTTAGS
jgi:hypothetical protein